MAAVAAAVVRAVVAAAVVRAVVVVAAVSALRAVMVVAVVANRKWHRCARDSASGRR